ncbi:MAG: hypothetical protein II131_01860, partial [Neisseriaceae bacterium]|nr:hypothetical protein [Neisseriaceae bacterium]
EKPVGIGYWLGMEILLIIPVVNLVFALIMSFAAENESKRNYFRGWLLTILIVIVLFAALFVMGGLSGGMAR